MESFSWQDQLTYFQLYSTSVRLEFLIAKKHHVFMFIRLHKVANLFWMTVYNSASLSMNKRRTKHLISRNKEASCMWCICVFVHSIMRFNSSASKVRKYSKSKTAKHEYPLRFLQSKPTLKLKKKPWAMNNKQSLGNGQVYKY